MLKKDVGLIGSIYCKYVLTQPCHVNAQSQLQSSPVDLITTVDTLRSQLYGRNTTRRGAVLLKSQAAHQLLIHDRVLSGANRSRKPRTGLIFSLGWHEAAESRDSYQPN